VFDNISHAYFAELAEEGSQMFIVDSLAETADEDLLLLFLLRVTVKLSLVLDDSLALDGSSLELVSLVQDSFVRTLGVDLDDGEASAFGGVVLPHLDLAGDQIAELAEVGKQVLVGNGV